MESPNINSCDKKRVFYKSLQEISTQKPAVEAYSTTESGTESHFNLLQNKNLFNSFQTKTPEHTDVNSSWQKASLFQTQLDLIVGVTLYEKNCFENGDQRGHHVGHANDSRVNNSHLQRGLYRRASASGDGNLRLSFAESYPPMAAIKTLHKPSSTHAHDSPHQTLPSGLPACASAGRTRDRRQSGSSKASDESKGRLQIRHDKRLQRQMSLDEIALSNKQNRTLQFCRRESDSDLPTLSARRLGIAKGNASRRESESDLVSVATSASSRRRLGSDGDLQKMTPRNQSRTRSTPSRDSDSDWLKNTQRNQNNFKTKSTNYNVATNFNIQYNRTKNVSYNGLNLHHSGTDRENGSPDFILGPDDVDEEDVEIAPPKETVDKCRKWMETLPERFSGMHVLPPISNDIEFDNG